MFGFFKKGVEKKDLEQLKQAVQTAFNNVKQDIEGSKQDINNLGVWTKHLNEKDSKIYEETRDIRGEMENLREEVESLKNILSIIGERPAFKQKQTVFNKQIGERGVLNTVQTGVQTVYLDNLSTTERAIVFVLLNADMKLSYEDLAAMLGKRKATIRGQINSIKQKTEGLIEEIIGENNKKRVFIPEKVKEILLRSNRIKKQKRKVINKEEVQE